MANKFIDDGTLVLNELSDYLDTSADENTTVIDQVPMKDIINDLSLLDLLENGGLEGERLQKFTHDYLNLTTKLHHPQCLAHQISAPHSNGAYAAMIDGLTNNETSIYEMGPATTTIEYIMINWMLEKIGWTPSPLPGSVEAETMTEYAGGVMTHGGSLANLTAMLAARSAKFPNLWRDGTPGNMVILVPEQSHYSLKRTAGIMGLGERNCIALPADQDGRVLPSEIPAMLETLKDENKQVLAIVGNACGTAAGLYDPLKEMGEICQKHDIWFHVDAAHGAGAIICDELRYLVEGIELADSVIWDAHKMFRTPALCATILVKDHRHINSAFSQDASYMFHEKDQPGVDLALRTLECTKSALGVKMFMTVAAMGEQKLADYISGRTKLTQDAAEYINSLNDFECGVTPETNIICFRIDGDDQRQLDIRKKLLNKGDFYITTTKYKNRWWLRRVFISTASELRHFKKLIDEIREINKSL
ncbi:pyridoxal phosphate-dependent decarboxylase family protein [Pseudemcibacter aquimaris]|uniref:pyridoxal phosphate-dependent decarboxylase family protein n=1 Tax=Pseudemcibacter aquimaris TaxID=2857064 RepID=UPI00201183AB|nr:pyridoxal-dependent decarboxylase [Pseudemcibacter aquimaris]MCC3860346.1 hypothetical protein [Pseudemcibacter aquimaris]WDU57672.1 aminotransferase class V-fold PLP-dependent enzyme [Pseudemcibacter aquimaris]